jgi:predicted amidohydrolase
VCGKILPQFMRTKEEVMNRHLCLLAVLCLGLSPLRPNATRGESPRDDDVGRPVRVVSLSFRGQPLEDVKAIVDREGAEGADLIVLPETWRGQNDQSMETLEGESIKVLRALASKHNTYVINPIDRVDEGRRLNSAVLIDRHGEVAGIYDKTFPYWSEFDHHKPVSVAAEVPVFKTDFGLVGIAICFDVNFPEVWQRLADQGAELVIWPSAYSAGTSLQAHAINHHYYIVTATHTGDCQVYDITGQRILDERGDGIHVSRITLDLDRGIYHQNFNIAARDKLLSERSLDIAEELFLDREQWFVLRALRPGVSARELAKNYGLEELRAYISRSREEMYRRRGGEIVPLAAYANQAP